MILTLLIIYFLLKGNNNDQQYSMSNSDDNSPCFIIVKNGRVLHPLTYLLENGIIIHVNVGNTKSFEKEYDRWYRHACKLEKQGLLKRGLKQ